MTTSSADTATSLHSKLGDIVSSWNVTAFQHNHLGRLPVKPLETINQCIPARQLPAVACASSRLQDLAGTSLYGHVDLGDNRETGWVL